MCPISPSVGFLLAQMMPQTCRVHILQLVGWLLPVFMGPSSPDGTWAIPWRLPGISVPLANGNRPKPRGAQHSLVGCPFSRVPFLRSRDTKSATTMFVVPPFRHIPKATGPSFVVTAFRSTSASLLSAGFPTFCCMEPFVTALFHSVSLDPLLYQ